MQNLVQRRFHPRALTGGENDGGERPIGGQGFSHDDGDAISALPWEALPTHGAAMQSLPATVVFDLDGTLVDTAPDLCAALNHALAVLGRPGVPADDVRHMVGHGARKLLENGLAATGAVSPELIEAGVAPFLAFYADNIAVGSRPYPGVEAALDALAAAGSRVAICTNKPAALSQALVAALGWTDRFAANLGFDSVPAPKPDPGHLWATIAAVGGDAATTMFVGDSITDTTTAKAAGVPVVAVSFGFSDRPAALLGADLVIDHYADLLPALRTLMARR
jgi:phosphoglycolate phosphatase